MSTTALLVHGSSFHLPVTKRSSQEYGKRALPLGRPLSQDSYKLKAAFGTQNASELNFFTFASTLHTPTANAFRSSASLPMAASALLVAALLALNAIPSAFAAYGLDVSSVSPISSDCRHTGLYCGDVFSGRLCPPLVLFLCTAPPAAASVISF